MDQQESVPQVSVESNQTDDTASSTADQSAAIHERRGSDRRGGEVVDRRLWLDRRRGPGRRRSEDRRSAEEGEISDEQFAFLMAISEYKRVNNRQFPSWTEVLEVVKALGYRKVAEPASLR